MVNNYFEMFIKVKEESFNIRKIDTLTKYNFFHAVISFVFAVKIRITHA